MRAHEPFVGAGTCEQIVPSTMDGKVFGDSMVCAIFFRGSVEEFCENRSVGSRARCFFSNMYLHKAHSAPHLCLAALLAFGGKAVESREVIKKNVSGERKDSLRREETILSALQPYPVIDNKDTITLSGCKFSSRFQKGSRLALIQ